VNGEYRGAAHSECNLQFRLRKDQQRIKDSFRIPVLFHNLRGYDSHLIMQAIGKYKSMNIRVIPNTMEKYVSFSLGNLKFIDSYQFMAASLQKLVANLAAEGKDKFTNLIATFENREQQDLLVRKGVYPYDFVDTPDKFSQTHLPTKKDFYNQLSDEDISDEDYTHAQKVCYYYCCYFDVSFLQS
jgi:hypothetical protein